MRISLELSKVTGVELKKKRRYLAVKIEIRYQKGVGGIKKIKDGIDCRKVRIN